MDKCKSLSSLPLWIPRSFLRWSSKEFSYRPTYKLFKNTFYWLSFYSQQKSRFFKIIYYSFPINIYCTSFFSFNLDSFLKILGGRTDVWFVPLVALMPMIMIVIVITLIIKWHSFTAEHVLSFPWITLWFICSNMLSRDFTEYAWYQEWKFVFAKVKAAKPAEV
jgi:hypothetical protein